jgi:O-antigen/teichoic acid export membrane protein
VTSGPDVTRDRRSPSPAARRGAGGRALGGVAAQLAQATASFALQILAVRLLGLESLGVFATVYALIVLGTALLSGFLGDSLTVLDRGDHRIRAALQGSWLMLPAMAGVLLGVGLMTTELVPAATAWMAGLAAAVFLAEDILRRLLMAELRFWRIVVVDSAGLFTAVGVIVTAALTTDLGLFHFFLALTLGQSVAAGVAVAMLPRAERVWVSLRSPALGAVAQYGSWRALQQAIKPAVLAAVRVVGIAVLSAAAVGELDAARIYISPATILVAGISTVLFARYARERTTPIRTLVRRCDRAAAGLVAMVAVLTIGALLVRPWVEPVLTGGTFELTGWGILGWGAYAAATAVAAPYGSLAAVRSRQSVVVTIRLVEALVAMVLVTTLLYGGGSLLWAPYLLAAAFMAGGLLLRWVVLGRWGERS